MTMPPMDPTEPPLWMAVEDIFHIKGRGTVVTGQLEGQGLLSADDVMLTDDGQRWLVSRVEQFGKVLETAVPGANIGVLLGHGPAPDLLRGRRVWFVPANAAGTDGPFTAFTRKKKRWRG